MQFTSVSDRPSPVVVPVVSSCEWLAELRGFETCQVISIHAASGVLVSPSVLDAEIYRQMDPLCFHFLWCICLCCIYYLAHLEKSNRQEGGFSLFLGMFLAL